MTSRDEARAKAHSEAERAQRNINPHAEAIVAMHVWSSEYAKLTCGCMDFWDGLSVARKKQCRDTVDRILKTQRAEDEA